MMILQKLLFMTSDHDEDLELYFRDSKNEYAKADSLVIPAGQTVSLETYFNSFSIGKWTKYTKLSNLTLKLEGSGDYAVKAYHAIGKKEMPGIEMSRSFEEKKAFMSVTRTEIPVKVSREAEETCVSFDRLADEGIYYVEITAASDTVIRGGAYVTDIDESELNPIDLALCICTFKREKELKRNVDAIVGGLIEDASSVCSGHVTVYISDNGQTLPEDFCQSDRVHVYKNKNAGGAGGFTRTMIESVFRNTTAKHSHVILMDDDIELDTKIVERTYNLLAMIKPEYQRAITGGAMMELHSRYMQFENGATWGGIRLRSFNHEWDMRYRDAVAANEELNDVNYTGWWYCCIPTSRITEDNLPMPMFIHYDDIEYGQRNSDCGVILMNGLCVWHPYGNNKQPISMNYYDERNILIAMSGKKERADKGELIDHLARIITRDVIRYSYDAAETCFAGIDDFLKGPEYFMGLDPIAQHQKLGKKNYKYEAPNPEIDLTQMRDRAYETYPSWIPAWEVICYILPAFKKLQIVSEADIGYAFNAKRIYLYDRNKKAGMMTVKNWGRTFKLMGMFFKLTFIYLTKTEKVMNEWREATPKFTNLAFWEKYLEI